MAWIADALVLLGLIVMTIGVIGVQRMPDVYLQLHAASKAVFLGIIALVVASIATEDVAIMARGLLIAAFLLLTTPVSAHAIGRAAHLREQHDRRSGGRPPDGVVPEGTPRAAADGRDA